jgi:ATP-binding cassette, subfamily B, multidrug efflux pump
MLLFLQQILYIFFINLTWGLMKSEKKAAFRFLFSYVKVYWIYIVLGLLCACASVVLQTITPLFLGAAIDYISSDANISAVKLPAFLTHFLQSDHSTKSTLVRLALILMGIAGALAIFRTLSRILIANVSRHVDYDIRNDYMGHLQKMSQHFFQQNKTGDLMARATNDLRAIQRLSGFGFMMTISTLLMFIFALNFMFRISIELTFLALAPLPLVVIIMYSSIGKIHTLFNYIQEQFATLTSRAQENFSGMRVIKSYVRDEWEINSFKKENQKYIDRNISMVKIDAVLDASLVFLLGIGSIVILWIGGRHIISGKISFGQIVALISYVAILAWPMEAVGYLLIMWQKAITAAQRVQQILNHSPDIADNEQTNHTIQSLDGSLVFENVSYTYAGAQEETLKDISFSANQGQTIAIVGSTGSGKSTLIHLLPRLIEPSSGAIRFGGHELSTIPLQVLRRNMGVVQQESFLFSESLSGNIAFGVADVDDAIIAKATEISQLQLDVDQFPDGLETVIGERGITLSGGQKQRTSISRAVIRKPALLILDDALSAVDTYTEEEILRQIRPIMKECTTIIVAHRISTIRDADLILVLDDGTIVERGTHNELVKNNGLYFKMHERQRLEDTLQDIS